MFPGFLTGEFFVRLAHAKIVPGKPVVPGTSYIILYLVQQTHGTPNNHYLPKTQKHTKHDPSFWGLAYLVSCGALLFCIFAWLPLHLVDAGLIYGNQVWF